MMRRGAAGWTGVLLAGLVAGSAAADVVALQAIADNTLYEDPQGLLSNGSGDGMFAGRTVAEFLRRALVRFDVSAIPTDATIESVTLTLSCTRSISLGEVVSLHRVTATWGEGASVALGEGGIGVAAEADDATWTRRFHADVPWANAGGDFVEQASAEAVVGGIGSWTWTSAGLAADVGAWVRGEAVNAGWAVVGAENVTGSAKRFATREHAEVDLRPVLLVTYTPVPAPGTAVAVAAGSMWACRRRRKKF